MDFRFCWNEGSKKGEKQQISRNSWNQKSGVSPLSELQNMESVHLWNQEIRSCSTFGTKIDGVSPFLELENPESVRNHSYKRNLIDSGFSVLQMD